MTQQYEDSQGPLPRITDAGFRLHYATSLFDRLIDEYLRAEWQLPATQFYALMALAAAGKEKLSVREIAEQLGISRAAAATRTRTLVKVGFASLYQDPNDRRTQRVALTERGARRLTEAWQGLDTFENALLTGIDERSLLQRINVLIDNARDVAAARQARETR
ncbi:MULTISPECIES: MarR family winged helix-turn-helix transcriptional regulator [unclassified Pseudoclavibacter]|uniref:MarR family winged helix-turn-helix transcriptional regulator n=1 Tax=unclassified Pseudoclavibacter TaxID=2615177 RepID=UPI0013017710|nr:MULTISPECIES: MarR family winged helix-turn-helix transcriptional regulator [unclassified Pseudoclavibacter]KAB1644398.1 winged helix-turn-helix transcriptional regulator [Pseudoclavibacter sp. CFCC 14310]KAB1664099.1 winged helix-turn-helix transcriptional regulator [Pseudoclavibacter sp. CFCC 13611]